MLKAAIAETASGFAGVLLTERGIRYATLFHATREACEGELRAAGGGEVDDSSPEAEAVVDALKRYAAGERDALAAFPVDLGRCTEMQRRTWLALREIPAGETRSYGWLAKELGRAPGAARAVGAAVGANPVPLWLPCHRVVAADGSLHGFGGGLAMKRALLELEGALPRALPL